MHIIALNAYFYVGVYFPLDAKVPNITEKQYLCDARHSIAVTGTLLSTVILLHSNKCEQSKFYPKEPPVTV